MSHHTFRSMLNYTLPFFKAHRIHEAIAPAAPTIQTEILDQVAQKFIASLRPEAVRNFTVVWSADWTSPKAAQWSPVRNRPILAVSGFAPRMGRQPIRSISTLTRASAPTARKAFTANTVLQLI